MDKPRVSAEQLTARIVEAAGPRPHPPGAARGLASIAAPSWLGPILANLAAKYGPQIEADIKDQLIPAIGQYIIGHFHVTPQK